MARIDVHCKQSQVFPGIKIDKCYLYKDQICLCKEDCEWTCLNLLGIADTTI